MQPTPPKPPQPAPEETPTSENFLDITPKDYYQAIGWLRGKLVKMPPEEEENEKEKEYFGIQIRDALFTLYIPRRVLAIANSLLEQMVWIKCYPQSKGEGLSFKAVWMGTEQDEKGEAGIFVLRGVWQFIPQCRRPVFSIYRNELKSYENRPTNQHLPLIWSDQPPYRFRKDSEERASFYQITARLIPQRSCFGFVSQIADPIEQTPKRVKKPPMINPNVEKPKPKSADAKKSKDKDKETSPVTEEVNIVAEETPPVTEEANIVTKEALSVTEEVNIVAEEALPVTEEVNIVAEEAPPVTEEVNIVAEEAPPVTEEVNIIAEEAPPVTETEEVNIVAEEAPPVTEEVNIVAEDAPPVTEEVNIVAEDAPPVTEGANIIAETKTPVLEIRAVKKSTTTQAKAKKQSGSTKRKRK